MRKTIVSLVDDLDGTEASGTVTFGIDGSSFEIDLSEANTEALRHTLGGWVARARRAGTPARQLATRRTTVLPAVGQSRHALIRAWAAEAGRAVPARGRIPREVVAAYDAARR